MSAKIIKGSTVNNRLKANRGPNSDALMSFATGELQKGQAFAANDTIKKHKTNRILMTVDYK